MDPWDAHLSEGPCGWQPAATPGAMRAIGGLPVVGRGRGRVPASDQAVNSPGGPHASTRGTALAATWACHRACTRRPSGSWPEESACPCSRSARPSTACNRGHPRNGSLEGRRHLYTCNVQGVAGEHGRGERGSPLLTQGRPRPAFVLENRTPSLRVWPAVPEWPDRGGHPPAPDPTPARGPAYVHRGRLDHGRSLSYGIGRDDGATALVRAVSADGLPERCAGGVLAREDGAGAPAEGLAAKPEGACQL